MDKEAQCCSTHLIEGDGTFNAVGLDNFIKQVKLAECGLSYAVVAIMGPQSSGIWIARCAGIEPCTIVMDLEGTDGRERGEDDTAFEKQSALFALAVSDIVLINMWCHDIGREQAANKPLLKTVFQVMLRLFSPRKTTLMFVIRDKTRTPLENLEPVLREDIQKIWDSVPKPEAHKRTPLSDFFNVQVVALSSYEEKEEQFKEQKFFHSIAPGGLAGDRRGVVPASGFSFSAQQIWKVIKENKDLDLPAHKDWLELEEAVQSQLVPGFGRKLSNKEHLLSPVLEDILLLNFYNFFRGHFDIFVFSYDEEATYFEDSVRSTKRKQLEEKLLQLVQPAYQLMLEHIRSGTLDYFKKALNDSLNGGQGFAAAARDCTTKSTRLSVEALLEGGSDDTWPAIRKLLNHETETAISEFSVALSGFEMDEEDEEDMISKLRNYARGVVEAKTREEAGRVLFTSIFNHDNDSMPRVWTGKEDIRAITKTARSSSLKLLSVLAAIRLDEDTDTIGDTLVLALVDPKKGSGYKDTHNSCSEANKRNNNWLPPPWAIAAMVVLGFNEFMTLLRNPLWLLVIFVSYLLLKALWVQLDISGEFRNGAFLPTVTNLLRKLAEEGQRPTTTDAHSNTSNPPQASRIIQGVVGSNSGFSSTASSEVTMENEVEYTSPSRHDKDL
ncbi:hypothetical protein Ccrd_015768, partial [Cynara cardunculus var. scolymus]